MAVFHSGNITRLSRFTPVHTACFIFHYITNSDIDRYIQRETNIDRYISMLVYTFLYNKAVYKISFEHGAYMAFLFSAIPFLVFVQS